MNDQFLAEILLFPSNIDPDRFQGIIIEEAINNLSELKEIEIKYFEKFAKLKYKIIIKDYQHPQRGHCTRFYIAAQRMNV